MWLQYFLIFDYQLTLGALVECECEFEWYNLSFRQSLELAWLLRLLVGCLLWHSTYLAVSDAVAANLFAALVVLSWCWDLRSSFEATIASQWRGYTFQSVLFFVRVSSCWTLRILRHRTGSGTENSTSGPISVDDHKASIAWFCWLSFFLPSCWFEFQIATSRQHHKNKPNNRRILINNTTSSAVNCSCCCCCCSHPLAETFPLATGPNLQTDSNW